MTKIFFFYFTGDVIKIYTFNIVILFRTITIEHTKKWKLPNHKYINKYIKFSRNADGLWYMILCISYANVQSSCVLATFLQLSEPELNLFGTICRTLINYASF